MDSENENIKVKKKQNNKFNYNYNQEININVFKNIILICLLIIILYKLNKLKFFCLENKTILNYILKITNSKSGHKINISDKIKLLKEITNNNELEYKGIKNCLENDPDSQYCIYHLILPKEVIGKKRILLGNKSDGSYVLLDDFKNIKIAYSFGIGKRIQFDNELAKRGIDIYMYDHTINSLPYNNPKFHWEKIGLAGKNHKNARMRTLEELISKNGHESEKNMILKIDIEKWEWESLINLKEDTLNQFKYILIEYHFIDEKQSNITYLYYQVIKKLSTTHQAFYVRCNGNRSKIVNFGNNRICWIMEVSYIIRKGNLFKKDETIYPMYEFDYIKPKDGKLEMNLNLLKLFD